VAGIAFDFTVSVASPCHQEISTGKTRPAFLAFHINAVCSELAEYHTFLGNAKTILPIQIV
jgi:hypothetical protein